MRDLRYAIKLGAPSSRCRRGMRVCAEHFGWGARAPCCLHFIPRIAQVVPRLWGCIHEAFGLGREDVTLHSEGGWLACLLWPAFEELASHGEVLLRAMGGRCGREVV